MSFSFQWPRFSDQFHNDAIQMLNNALNKGNKPPVIADRIEVVELEMGTEPPELEIRDIGDLTMDQFRGIFRLSYNGDAHIVLKTKVQANPLNHKQPDIHLLSGSRGMLAAKEALVVPMLLRLSHIKLSSYVVLVVSRSKGITIVFKTDPLQHVDINSSFDSIAVIQKFIQKEIEGQLRQMFKEDLPGIIHRLSQQWVKAKIEPPLSSQRPNPISRSPRRRATDTMSAPDLRSHRLPPLTTANVGLRNAMTSTSLDLRSRRSPSSNGSTRSRRSKPPIKSPLAVASGPNSHDSDSSHEEFDPTYGLRPESVPTKSDFTSLGRLFHPAKGLADLAEDDERSSSQDLQSESDDGSYENSDIEDNYSLDEDELAPTYENVPAVGGGTISKPRVLHSAGMQSPSLDQATTTASSATQRPAGTRQTGYPYVSPAARSGYFSPQSSPINATFNTSPRKMLQRSQTAPQHRPNSPGSVSSEPTHSVATPPATLDFYEDDVHIRRSSVDFSSLSFSGSPPRSSSEYKRPTPLNDSMHQLSTLSSSNQTLSPYTRSLSHFTVRSVPPRVSKDMGTPVVGLRPKARRKRTYRLGSKPTSEANTPINELPESARTTSFDPIPTSDLDAADLELYFPSHSALHDPPTPPTIRRRPARKVS